MLKNLKISDSKNSLFSLGERSNHIDNAIHERFFQELIFFLYNFWHCSYITISRIKWKKDHELKINQQFDDDDYFI